MKKAVSYSLLSGTLVFFSWTLMVPAIAATDTSNAGNETADSSTNSATTTITATFNAGKDQIIPVDPDSLDQITNPENEKKNNGINKLGTGLALAYVPEKLTFTPVSLKLFGETTTSIANGFEKPWSNNPNLVWEIGDERGSHAGWQLSVTGDTLTSTTDKTITVPSATLKFDAGTVKGTAEKALATGHETTIDLGGENKAAPTNYILSAQQGTGYGMTTYQLEPKHLNLTVPADTVRGSYTTTLTWTLADKPNA